MSRLLSVQTLLAALRSARERMRRSRRMVMGDGDVEKANKPYKKIGAVASEALLNIRAAGSVFLHET